MLLTALQMSRTRQNMIEDEAYGAWTRFSQMMNSCGFLIEGGSQRKHGLPTPLPQLAMVWTSIKKVDAWRGSRR